MGAMPANVRQPYPRDLTEKEWALIAPYVPHATPGGHPQEHPKREILNGIFYVLRRGCAWRMVPHDFPPWQSVYQYFRGWQHDGTWHVIHDLLRGDMRVAEGRHRQPSAGVIDSQSVKTTEKGESAATRRTNLLMAGSDISSWIH